MLALYGLTSVLHDVFSENFLLFSILFYLYLVLFYIKLCIVSILSLSMCLLM